MDKVYLLWRVVPLSDNDELIGVFATYAEAEQLKSIFGRRHSCYVAKERLGDVLV